MCREQHIETLLQHLIERRKHLSDILSGELSNLHNSDDPIGGDVIDLTLEKDYATVNATLAEAESKELEEVNDAINRIENGSYGVCEDCDKPIPISRLKAVPYAKTCIRCRQARDVRTRAFRLASEEPAHEATELISA